MRLEDLPDEICGFCGRSFEAGRITQKYCSARCRKRAQRRFENGVRDEIHRRQRAALTCRRCGVPIAGAKRRDQKWCSATCRSRAWAERQRREAVACR